MHRPVREFMTRSVVTIRRDADVHELEKLFIDHGIHGVPVIDSDDRLVGVVSQSDLISWHYSLGIDGWGFYDVPQLRPAEAGDEGDSYGDSEDEPTDEASERELLPLADVRTALVEEVMTPLVHAIREDNSATEAAARMLRHGIHRLVVVDADLRVRGIICAMDLLRLIPGVKSAGSVVSGG